MRSLHPWCFAPLFFALPVGAAIALPSTHAPVPVILDTDMGNDVDDALALAMLHAFQTRGASRLVAVTVSKSNPWAAEFVQLENEFYGRGSIPVGLVRGGKTPDEGKYVRAVCEKHGRTAARHYPDAVSVLEKSLRGEPDHSVVLFQIGFSTNLARLIETPGGLELVRRKARMLYLMAGNFVQQKPEYNVVTDVPAARSLFRDWPTEMVFSGFEIGAAILFPSLAIQHDFQDANPVAEAYRLYDKMPYDRPSWDLTAVLEGLRGDRNYFEKSERGTVEVKDDGNTVFTARSGGTRRYLRLPNDTGIVRIREALVWSSSEPR